MLSKYHIFTSFATCIVGLSIAIFPKVAHTPLTFAQMNQDKVETMEKYKNDWNNHTIKHVRYNTAEYHDGDIVATITIPKMEIYELPVYYGANPVNNNWHITTSGHAGNYAMFGESGVSSIGAHNYQLFKNLPDLKTGDKLIVETDVDRYVYVVDSTDIYDHTKDVWNQKATAHKSDHTLTLMTCYPLDGIQTNDMYLVYTSLQKGTIFGQ
ncbi:sortase [Anaerorhabdus furcosa]|uniref:LPXTG-site transpeptidase (Sortase) family protein n=1 Tax=Anaerorhabdus furcosa TaxID=118967 RepID=A0A1T4QKZ5_9FIRM|nr:sortase [Anaerorhabdus furcosa]SKA04307.1 LPXTG-site transpeptidase (sortase) family protein [Anaerorhabdus furcosa]